MPFSVVRRCQIILQFTADVALAEIVGQLGNAPPRGWRYVTFDRSRDFSAALRGERLRPTDVDACPELPAAAPRLGVRAPMSCSPLSSTSSAPRSAAATSSAVPRTRFSSGGSRPRTSRPCRRSASGPVSSTSSVMSQRPRRRTDNEQLLGRTTTTQPGSPNLSQNHLFGTFCAR